MVVWAACGQAAGTPDAPINCEAETRDDELVAGFAKSSGDVTFTLTALSPEPPARNNNEWTMALSDGGAPWTDAVVTAVPFMPAHAHGAGVDVVVTPDGAGNYALTPLRLWMPGLWEVTVRATGGGRNESVVFRPCIRP